MHLSVWIYSSILLTTLIYASADDRKCTCRNWYKNVDYQDKGHVLALKRQIIKYVLTEYIPEESGIDGIDSLIVVVLAHVEWCSETLLNALFEFAFWALPHILAPGTQPGLCTNALVVNASADRYIEGINYALETVVLSVRPACKRMRAEMGINSGCIKRANFQKDIDSDCYKKGKVYKIYDVLRTYSNYLPKNLEFAIIRAYNSRRIGDNVLAAAFALSVTPVARRFVANQNLEVIIRTFEYAMEKDLSKCCCKQRKNDITDLCNQLMESGKQLLTELKYVQIF